MQFATKFANGGLPAIDQTLKEFQQANLALRYCKVPTVAATMGYVLGGGCEIMMHCDRAVAAVESYIGLVEVGVGILPAAGGSKEMALRALNTQDPEKSLQSYFKNIAMAEVAKSAHEAKEMGYLRPDDVIVFHPQEILHVAKSVAESLFQSNYVPLQPPAMKVLGRDALANMLMMIVNLKEGRFASEYDASIASYIADVMTGGRLQTGQIVDEEWFLRKERENFLCLVQQEKTHQRIEHMLETGKPLRN
jgi:3-hydroxyacyl-CoA dehydrogenase